MAVANKVISKFLHTAYITEKNPALIRTISIGFISHSPQARELYLSYPLFRHNLDTR